MLLKHLLPLESPLAYCTDEGEVVSVFWDVKAQTSGASELCLAELTTERPARCAVDFQMLHQVFIGL